MRTLAVGIALCLWTLGPAVQAQTYEGLGLNHPALSDDYFGDDWVSGPFATASSPNAEAKGLGPGASTVAFARGGIRAGLEEPYIATSGGAVNFGSRVETLLPPFADGFIFGYTSGTLGLWIEGHLYEPDLVKRKTSASSGKSRVVLKQKSFVAIRMGAFDGSVRTSSPDFAYVQRCKGQADIRTDPPKGVRTVKLKVSCKGNEAIVQTIKTQLTAILDKPKSAFELVGSQPLL
jgi:hypothetical protein